MEQRFGHDFGQVRVHTDARATQSAQAVSANAYTVGHNVVFGVGRFAPGTHEGRRLIAHELTHVVQQSGSDRKPIGHGTGERGLYPIAKDQAAELEAYHLEGLGHGGTRTRVATRTAVGVARQPKAAPKPAENPELELGILLSLDPMTAEHARKGFEWYRKLPDVKRKAVFDRHVKTGDIKRWMFALSKTDAIESFVPEVMQDTALGRGVGHPRGGRHERRRHCRGPG